jgi:hypothetical protein
MTKHHYMIKYEDLLGADGWRALQNALQWLGLVADDDFCHRTIESCTIERLRKDSKALKAGEMISGDPAGFYRKGQVDSWSSELSRQDVESIEYIAGPLMRDCGYAATTKFAARTRKPLRLKLYELLDGLQWRGDRALGRTFERLRSLI